VGGTCLPSVMAAPKPNPLPFPELLARKTAPGTSDVYAPCLLVRLLRDGVAKEKDFVVIRECHDRDSGVLIVEAWIQARSSRRVGVSGVHNAGEVRVGPWRFRERREPLPFVSPFGKLHPRVTITESHRMITSPCMGSVSNYTAVG
jgi:hypothetical protein